MTEISLNSPKTGPRTLIRSLNGLIGRFLPADLALLAARLFVGVVFWKSARTKVDGFAIADSTWFLFQHEYALPLIPYQWAAVMATLGEHVFSVLLIAGLFGRFAAGGMLAMTLVIQIFVYSDAWITHGLWAASLLAVLSQGPGRLSLDRALGFER
jgi:putative oxidoreductase